MAIKEQWLKIKEIVGAALEREPKERGAFLDQACPQDRELRAEVESLFAAHVDAVGLSENPWAATTVADAAGESKAIGPYRLIQVFGVGEKGRVLLAEQTSPVRRRVALKLIRASIYDSSLAQRFQSERQSLAIMERPTIAKVFDAGTTPEGQPYFVMEYVDGLPITEYCDRKKLAIQKQLNLFIKVCAGVRHAHQKAIIPSRPEAFQHSDDGNRRQTGATDHRLRFGESDGAARIRRNAVYPRGRISGDTIATTSLEQIIFFLLRFRLFTLPASRHTTDRLPRRKCPACFARTSPPTHVCEFPPQTVSHFFLKARPLARRDPTSPRTIRTISLH
jgi:Protein kinase domain